MGIASVRFLAGVSSIAIWASAGAWAQTHGLEEVTGGGRPDFEHDNGMTGELYFPEMTGAGVALFDYDGDGDLDAYFVQGGPLGEGGGEGEAAGDRLLRNESQAGGLAWRDVTDAAGLRATGYGMAVATGDVNADGRPDLFLANYGANELWLNRGDGHFDDASGGLPQSAPRWTTAAVLVDLDRDGRDDIFAVNYVDYSIDRAPTCYSPSSMRDYCGPSGFDPVGDRFLLSRADGTFEDATSATGLGALPGAGLGVAVLDLDDDGSPELYVANDGQPNVLWRRMGTRWIDDALLAGVAVNRRGEPEASMGIAVGDVDRDGDEDLLVTHLDGESNTLYLNQGGGLFDDRTAEAGLDAPSLPYTGFGVAWLDLEHDGRLDFAVANGAVRIQERAAAAGHAFPLMQRNQLFAAAERGFVERIGEGFAAGEEVSRGLARGDVDNDGDHDLLLTNNSGPARLFAGGGARDRNWIGVVFARPRHQIVRAHYRDGRVVAERASAAGSYASASDSRILFTGNQRPIELSIGAAGGPRRRLLDPPMGSYLRFRSR